MKNQAVLRAKGSRDDCVRAASVLTVTFLVAERVEQLAVVAVIGGSSGKGSYAKRPFSWGENGRVYASRVELDRLVVSARVPDTKMPRGTGATRRSRF